MSINTSVLAPRVHGCRQKRIKEDVMDRVRLTVDLCGNLQGVGSKRRNRWRLVVPHPGRKQRGNFIPCLRQMVFLGVKDMRSEEK